jgi:hypothetical protein
MGILAESCDICGPCGNDSGKENGPNGMDDAWAIRGSEGTGGNWQGPIVQYAQYPWYPQIG